MQAESATQTSKLIAEADVEIAREQRKRTLWRVQAGVMLVAFGFAASMLVIDDELILRLLAAAGLVVSAVGGISAVELVSGRHDRFFGGLLASAWIAALILYMMVIVQI